MSWLDLTYATRSPLCSAELTRAEACTGSAVFRLKNEKVHPAAWYGIGIHRFLEKCKLGGKAHALEYTKRKFRQCYHACSMIKEEDIPPGRGEVAFAHDAAAGRAREVRFPDFGDESHELFAGKADVLDVNVTPISNNVVVSDYKTGAGPHDPLSDQMVGLAAAAVDALLAETPPVRVVEPLLYVVTDAVGVSLTDGKLIHHEARLSMLSLAAFKARAETVRLRVVEARVAFKADGTMPDFQAGAHCAWCGLRRICPATCE